MLGEGEYEYMASYKVVTVTKTVYVHGVESIYMTEADPDLPDEICFQRGQGSGDVRFPLMNVIHYERSDGGAR